MKITAKNITSIAIGTEVVMNWGAYYPTEEGLVVDYRVTPPSKYFPATYELVIEKPNGEVHYTKEFVEKGVGTYLKKVYMKG